MTRHSATRHSTTRCFLAAALLAASACNPSTPPELCPHTTVSERRNPIGFNVHVLVVLDDTHPVRRDALVAGLERFRLLVTEGDYDGDGLADAAHWYGSALAVVTSDLGTGPYDVATCSPGQGDAALFQGDGCLGTVTHAEVDACPFDVGASGCPVAQPLEAALRALTPRTSSDVAFLDAAGRPLERGQFGIGTQDFSTSGELVVLFVSSRDDASLADDALFSDTDPRVADVPLALRSVTAGDPSLGLLTSIDRYVEYLRPLVPDDRLVVGVLAGLPPASSAGADLVNVEVASDAQLASLDALVATLTAAQAPDASGLAVTPLCTFRDGDVDVPVVPAPRLAAAARALVATPKTHALLGSLCADDLTPFFDALAGLVSRDALLVQHECWSPRATWWDGTSHIALHEWTEPGGDCSTRPGRTFERVADDGRMVCTLAERTADEVARGAQGGFTMLEGDEALRRCGVSPAVHFLDLAGPEVWGSADTTIVFPPATLDDGSPDPDACEHCGWSCTTSIGLTPWTCADATFAGVALACDAVTDRCTLPCATDADCAALPGFVCDRRTNGEAAAPSVRLPDAVAAATRGVCILAGCE